MFHSLLENRRSIRKFENKAVEAEKIDLLVEAALRSPSSRGFNPWEFVVVTDQGLIKQLAQSNTKPNIIMWSWCGGCSDNTEDGINTYLNAMDSLEKQNPQIKFIYMTGHLDGSGTDGNLNQRNNQIRKYCVENSKTLFDFADIESFDPDGNSFLELNADDACRYDSNGDGKRDANWADQYLARHPDHNIKLPGSAAHTHPLNGALKGRAFWWMLARLAGWNGQP